MDAKDIKAESSELGRELISIRIDKKTLVWFKQQKTRGYQTLINNVLRSYVETQREEQLVQKGINIGRAQEIFKEQHAKCFWHYDPNLKITINNINLVIDGLRKHGGRKGMLLAEELCQ